MQSGRLRCGPHQRNHAGFSATPPPAQSAIRAPPSRLLHFSRTLRVGTFRAHGGWKYECRQSGRGVPGIRRRRKGSRCPGLPSPSRGQQCAGRQSSGEVSLSPAIFITSDAKLATERAPRCARGSSMSHLVFRRAENNSRVGVADGIVARGACTIFSQSLFGWVTALAT